MTAPIYIPSKGRAHRQMTSRVLSALGLPHFVVVEEHQRAEYEAEAVPGVTYLTLDPEYQRTYRRLVPDGELPGTGSGPARNFAWDHALAGGADWYWCMDDNIAGFWRLNYNRKIPVEGSAGAGILRAMETFAARYENVLMAGPHYYMFASRKARHAPFAWNRRIYSCNLIRTDAPFRWEGRYNEDTHLSLQMMKAGYPTVLFNTFLTWKQTTQTQPGGNTEDYQRDGTLAKSQLLVRLHPDVARLSYKFSRWHHEVDYDRFSDPSSPWYCHPRLRPGVELPAEADEFGMAYLEKQDGEWREAVPMPKAAPGAPR